MSEAVRHRPAPAPAALVAALALAACGGGDEVRGGAEDLAFEGGALDGSEDARLAAEAAAAAAAAAADVPAESAADAVARAAADVLASPPPAEVDWDTPIAELVAAMGLDYEKANAMMQLDEEVIRRLAAARKAERAFDDVDRTPPTPLGGGKLAIRFRHLALDVLDDEAYEALLDGISEKFGSPAGVADFPAEIRAFDGKDVALSGYMIPVEWDDAEVLEFMLVRDLLACCFGGSPQPDEWVKVRMVKGKGAHYHPFLPVIVHGRLSIRGMSDAVGYTVGCYHIDGHAVERAP